MLSASLVVYALKPAPALVIGAMRPAISAPAPVTVTQAAISGDEAQRRIQAAVERAVELKTKDLVKEIQSEHVRLMLAADQLEQDEQRMRRMQFLSANLALPETAREEVK
jgi:hypothetical protein